MQFTQPISFLLLGLIPVLILIHSLKPKPGLVPVTNLFLWQAVLKEKKGGIRIERLTRNLSLLLQILAVILASRALGGPVWLRPAVVVGKPL